MRLQLKRSSFHLIQVPPLELHIDVWSHDVVHEVSSWDLCRAKHRNRIDKDVFTLLAAAIPAFQVPYPQLFKSSRPSSPSTAPAKQALPKQIRWKCPALGLYHRRTKSAACIPKPFIYNSRLASRQERTYEKASQAILVRL